MTFTSYPGDVPLLLLSQGRSREVVKGKTQFVGGVSDYSTLLSQDQFTNFTSTYVRVAAVNAVGTSEFVSPLQNPVNLYLGAPLPPTSVQAVAPANATRSLQVYWQNLLNGSTAFAEYHVEYDTHPAFISYCTALLCSTLNSFPIGVVPATGNHSLAAYLGGSYYTYQINDLVAGQGYYVRVRGCYNTTTTQPVDRVCSPYGYVGFPGIPVSAWPMGVPDAVGAAAVTMLNSTAAAVAWYGSCPTTLSITQLKSNHNPTPIVIQTQFY